MKRAVLMLLVFIASASATAQDMNEVRPIAPLDSVWIEELTWMEVRDAIKAGKTTVIIGTGGVEQNGPFVTNGKHNYNLKLDAETIARKLGNALVAPVIGIGPSNWSHYPGTLALRRDVFKMVLADVSTSLQRHGFKDIILIGDNGGNQPPMKEVAAELNATWKGTGTVVHHVPEYYGSHDAIDKALPSMGIHQVIDKNIHDSYRVTALLLLANPEYVRLSQRMAVGKTLVNGVDIVPVEKTLQIARKIHDIKTNLAVDAIRKAVDGRKAVANR